MQERSMLESEHARVDAMTRAGKVMAESRKAFYDDDLLQMRMDRDFKYPIHTSYGAT